MKLLFKLGLIVLTIRVLAGSPRGGTGAVDSIANTTLRDAAQGISTFCAKVETTVVDAWKGSPPPKAVAHRGTNARRPAN